MAPETGEKMSNKKLIFIIAACIAVISAVSISGQLKFFRVLDYFTVLKAALLFGLAFLARQAETRLGDTGQSWVPRAAGVLWKLFLLLAAISLMKRGFDIYREDAIAKALLFFPAGLLLAFVFFYISDKTPRQVAFCTSSYQKRGNDVVFIPLKFLNALALSIIGVYMIKSGKWPLGDIAFLGAFAQLALVFRRENAVTASEPQAGEGTLPLQMKILSLLMIALSLFFYYRAYISVTEYDFKNVFVSFMIASTLFGLAPGITGFKKDEESYNRINGFDVFYMLFIFIFGLRLFSWDLFNIPPGVHGDEGWSVNFAQEMSRMYKPIFWPAEEATGPTLNFWIIAVLFKKIGIFLGAVKAYEIVITSAMLVVSYMIFKNLFNRTVGVLATLFTACFFLTLLYSRIGIQWMQVPLLACASLYMFYRGMKNGNVWFFIAAGFFMGIVQYFYNAAKIFPAFYIMYLPLLLAGAENRAKVFSNWRGILMLFVAAVLVYLPLLEYSMAEPSNFMWRISKASIIHHMPPTIEEIGSITKNIVRNLQMFFTLSANGYCHNLPQKPFFDALTGFWAIAGAGFLAFTWKREASLFVIVWLFVGLSAGFFSSLGLEDPFPSRVVIAIPVIGLFIIIGMERLMAKLSALWPNIFRPVAPFVYLAVFAFYVFFNFNNFFVMYKNDPHTIAYYRNADKPIAEAMTKDYATRIFKLSPAFWDSYYFGKTRYLSSPYIEKSRQGADVSVFRLNSLYNGEKKDVSIVGEGLYYKSLQIYREYYPGTKIRIIWDNNFWQFDKNSKLKYCYEWQLPDAVIDMNRNYHWFYTYDAKVPFVSVIFADIPFADIEALAGLKAEKYKGGVLIRTEKSADASVSFDGTLDKAVLSGLIDIPDYKKYEFILENGTGEIYIDGRPVKGPLIPYAGLHRIKVIMKREGTGTVNLKWKQEEQGAAAIPAGTLLNTDKVFGLIAEYRDKKNGGLIYQSLDPDIQQRFYWPLPRPAFPRTESKYDADIKWSGYIDMPENGKYEFKFDTGYTAKIVIDGKTVYEKTATPGKTGEAAYRGDTENISEVYLSKGRKAIVISAYYHYIDKYWYETAAMRFLYRTDSSREFGPVTYDMLSPGR